MAYATFGGGFKAGGFNPASPAGLEAYDEEHTWLLEGGVKRSWADGRMTTNASLFYLVWNDLQLNVPDLTLPSQFYISNVAGARSKGLELEVSARAAPGLDVFGAVGNTSAHFASRSVSNGVSVDGNRLANTPSYTFSAGAEYSRSLNQAATVYGRAEMAVYGAFQYDDANTRQQDAYSLANLRAGVRGANLFVEGWMRNAFDTRYIPVAFAYPGFAPSGFVGEMGPPRVFGITGGVRF
jgi:iron complex outermembrane receptor protein